MTPDKLPFGEQPAILRTPIPGPKSRELAKRLGSVEAPGVTFLANDFPIFWERAFGSNVEDVDGNLFVDLSAAFGVAALGHSDPTVSTTIALQAPRLSHGMGDVHPAALKVAFLEKLSSISPIPRSQILLGTSGAEAVEAALKSAYLTSGRPGVITFEGGYHGLSYGTLAVGGQLRFREPFQKQIAPFSFRARFPRTGGDRNREIIDQSIRELDCLVSQADEQRTPIGAILLEPIQGRAGIIVPPAGWLKAVREWSQKNHVLMIVDEIMTGFGRTGTWFAVQREKVVPDLLCVGKAMTNALPFSACIGSEEAMSGWPRSSGDALHTSTFLGYPLACAAALTTLKEIERRELPSRADRLGREALQEVREWGKSVPSLSDVRGMGFMIGLEITPPTPMAAPAFEIARRALGKGLIVLPSGMNGDVLSLTPALTIAGRQLSWALSILRQLLEELR